MTPEELDEAMGVLGLNAQRLALRMGVTDRTVRRWLDGTRQIPPPVARLMQMMLRPTTPWWEKDWCDVCRRPYRDREITFAGRDAAGLILAVGECCRHRLAWLMGGSVYFSGRSATALELTRQQAKHAEMRLNLNSTAWSKSDRSWFERHPQRAHRLRRAFPDEWPAGTERAEYSVVRQVEPGTRLRKPLSVVDPRLRNPIEAVAAAIFDLADEGGPREIKTEEVLARARQPIGRA